MQSALAGCLLLLALSVGFHGAAEAATGLRVLEQSTERTVVRLEWPEGERNPEAKSIVVALPGPRVPRLEILAQDSSSYPASSGELERLPQDSLVELGAPVRVRGVWRVELDLAVRYRDASGRGRQLRGITLVLEHPSRAGETLPAPADTRDDPARFLSTSAFVNPQAAKAFRRASVAAARETTKRRVEGDSFSRAQNWLRVVIVESGIYRIRYEDLELLLQDEAAAIDPTTLRLLSAPEVVQNQDPNVGGMSWDPGWELQERALHVEASAPAAGMGPGDELVFYAPGIEAWSDRHDPLADPLEHFEHEYADQLSFWLCWERVGEDDSDFPTPPLRMENRSVAPTAASPRSVSQHRERLHLERPGSMRYGIIRDNWAYNQIPIAAGGGSEAVPFTADHVVTDSTAYAFVDPVSLYVTGTPEVEIFFNTANLGRFTWRFLDQADGQRIRFGAEAPAPQDGDNYVTVINRSTIPSLDLDLVDVLYRRELATRAGRLEWLVHPDEAAAADTLRFTLRDDQGGSFDAGSVLLDTTNPWRPAYLEGARVEDSGRRLVFDAVARGGGRATHFAVHEGLVLRSPTSLQAGAPRGLRSEVFQSGGWDYLIIGPANLIEAFDGLAELRSRGLDDGAGNPLVSPRVALVDLQDVYDSFGHGAKEPAAIRNFLKFSYQHEVYAEAGRQTEYALLVGDASRDYRSHLPGSSGEQERDRCPTYVMTHWPLHQSMYQPETRPWLVPYATDDWMGAFDEPDSTRSSGLAPYDLGELGVGRAPVANASEAGLIADRLVEYAEDPKTGLWRDDVLLVCDDEVALAGGGSDTEKFHIQQGEYLSEVVLPPLLNVTKLYLTEYPNPPGPRNKPAARREMIRSWSDGKLVVHYIGHGSPKQLADEKVFLIEDVSALTNAERLSLFLAFSCDVAIYDSPFEKSMSEQLVLNPGGGAIATIAASQVTFVGSNNALTNAFYERLFPDNDPADSPPLGAVLRDARVSLGTSGFTNHNSLKYVLFGDPAMRLAAVEKGLDLGGALADSILTGRVGELKVRAADGGDLDGRYESLSREARDHKGYTRVDIEANGDTTIFHIDYVLDGGVFFRGVGTAQGESLQIQAPVPVQLRTGSDGGTVFLYSESASGGDMMGGVASPTPVAVRASSSEDTEGPRIQLGFGGSTTTVVSGDTLHVVLEDPSGINTLGSSPASRISLDFDDANFPLDITSLYRPDDDRYDRGRLDFALPEDLAPGAHSLLLSASDTRGNNSKASLRFTVKQEGALEIGGALAVPNPFSGSTRFVIELSEAASVELLVFTLDGRNIRKLEGVQPERGVLVLDWDGTDFRGDEIANGAYLFTVRAEFLGNTPDSALTLTRSGRVVRMR